MKEGELSSELIRFGVTKQEADLFLLLSRVRNSGSEGATGNELAELAELKRVRTYQVLDRLVDLGIVRVESGRPKRYSAENPQTAVRRLVALHESRLNELSLAEEELAEALSEAAPVVVRREGKSREGASKIAVLHGISAIQGLLRRTMESKDLRVIVNDESEGNIFTTIKYMNKKPRSVRMIFASRENREAFEGERTDVEGYKYRIRLFRGDLPTVVLNGEYAMLLFFESQRYRPRPLSAVTVRTVVSSCVVIEGSKHVNQIETMFGKLWDLSE
jgi:sugar-specific transcriptional regulator TrmB